uniref:Uncharacterized protein n=1 Tax=Arundo donax TaxID=35708 RepID=A0A0A9ED81_ARUDO
MAAQMLKRPHPWPHSIHPVFGFACLWIHPGCSQYH